MFKTNGTALVAQIQDLEALAAHFFRQAQRESRANLAEAAVRSTSKAIEAQDQAAALQTRLNVIRAERSARRERYIANLIAAQKLARWALSQQGKVSA